MSVSTGVATVLKSSLPQLISRLSLQVLHIITIRLLFLLINDLSHLFLSSHMAQLIERLFSDNLCMWGHYCVHLLIFWLQRQVMIITTFSSHGCFTSQSLRSEGLLIVRIQFDCWLVRGLSRRGWSHIRINWMAQVRWWFAGLNLIVASLQDFQCTRPTISWIDLIWQALDRA